MTISPDITDATGKSATAHSSSGTHRIALAFEDGVTRFITCREDQTVADASYRQRINIPLDCRDGACGTCKARCESGDFDGGTYIDDALSDDEAADGLVLPCSMRPRSDLVLQINSTSEVAKTRAAEFAGTLVELERLSPSTMRIGVDIANRPDLAFLPGQYVNITVPGTEESRSYSFSNAPDDERLTFLIKLSPGGLMSDYLTGRAGVGDPITLTGPHGSFFLRDTERPVLMLAGGTGLAPMLSMLRLLRDQKSTRTAHLIYGVSTDDDLVALDELDALAADLPGLTVDHTVSDPASTAVNKGRVMGLIGARHLHAGDVAVYLCGPPAMVESVRAHVGSLGVEPRGFYYEKFALAAAPGAETTDTADGSDPTGIGRPTPPEADEEQILFAPAARAIDGRTVFASCDITAWTGPVTVTDDGDRVRRIAGQSVFPARRPPAGTESETAGAESGTAGAESGTAGAESGSAEADSSPVTVTDDGYQIGEEHPAVHESDALFEAREALELGAVELVLGRVTEGQLAGYRLLADATLPYVDGESFTDASEYTETNAAFHDYLFTLTGNDHLLQAYRALGVKGRMSEVLRDATWCHPRCAIDHVDIVAAIAQGNRAEARALISAHAERSKQTMRRAMADRSAARTPRFVSPGRFVGKVVVVTGAAQGIGERVARRVSAEGGRVVLADRSELIKELVDDLPDHRGAIAVTADLEAFEGAENVVRQALSEFGRIDVMINNVGGAINFKPFVEFTDGQIRAEIDRSLMTTLYSCRAVLPSMVDRGGGVIVNVSSAATRGIHRIPYSAAKGGINAITASLAMEYAANGIRVVATAPGGTEAPPRRISRGTPTPTSDTERAWFQAHIDQTLDSSLMHRYGSLDEQAAAICFLASDEAAYITGTVLPVAGGDPG